MYQYAPVDLRTVANAVRVSTLRTLHHSAAQNYRAIDPVDGDRLVPLDEVTDTLPPHDPDCPSPQEGPPCSPSP